MTNVIFFKPNPAPMQYRGHEEAKETARHLQETDDAQRGHGAAIA